MYLFTWRIFLLPSYYLLQDPTQCVKTQNMLFQQNSGNANHNWMAGTDSSKQNYLKGVAIAGGGLLV
jgi:hypothetical protein